VRHTIGATAMIAALGGMLALASAPRAGQVGSDKVAKCQEFFGELQSALAELPGALNTALVASIQEERLQKKKGEEKGGRDWRCEATLLEAKDRSTDRRAEAGSILQRVKNKWQAAQGAGRELAPDQLPWGPKPEDRTAIGDAITRIGGLFRSIDSAQSSAGPKKLASIWKDAQEYASKQPKQLPALKAESIIPKSVDVPCISETVTVR